MYTIDTTTYRNFTINIHPDEYPSNSWKEWDCEPPIAVLSFGYHRSKVNTYGDQNVIRDVLNYWTPATLYGKKAKVLEALGATRKHLADFLWYNRDHYEPAHATIQLFEDFVVDWLTDYPESDSDLMEVIAALYRLASIPAGVQSTHGHSQGDYAEMLVVLTPEWVRKVGSPALQDETAAQQAITDAVKLWGDWAWGNVYGYTVTDPDGEDTDISCWEYYGDPKKSGLLDDARSEIDCAADERLARLARVQEGNRPDLYSGGVTA